MKKSKIISMVLAISTVLGCMSCAWATEINRPMKPTAIPVRVEQEGIEFSVTVPTDIPIYVDKDGNVTMPDNIEIVNNSIAPIKIAEVEITGKDGWTRTDNTDGWQLNDKKFAMTLDYEGDKFTAWTFAIAPQLFGLQNKEIADVTIVVNWDTSSLT